MSMFAIPKAFCIRHSTLMFGTFILILVCTAATSCGTGEPNVVRGLPLASPTLASVVPTQTATPEPRIVKRVERSLPLITLPQRTESTFETFRHPIFNYSLLIPSDWQEDFADQSTLFFSPRSDIVLSVSRHEDLSKIRPDVHDLQSYIVMHLRIVSTPDLSMGSVGSYHFLRMRRVEINGHTGIETESLRPGTIGIEHVLAVHLWTGEYFYSIEADVDPSQFREKENLVRQILMSFDPGSSPDATPSLTGTGLCKDNDIAVTDVRGVQENRGSWVKVSGTIANTCDSGVYLSIDALAINDRGVVIGTGKRIWYLIFEEFETAYPLPVLYIAPGQLETVSIYISQFDDTPADTAWVEITPRLLPDFLGAHP